MTQPYHKNGIEDMTALAMGAQESAAATALPPPPSMIDTLGMLQEEPEYAPEQLDQVALEIDHIEHLLADDPVPVPQDSVVYAEDEEVVALFEDRLEESSAFREPFEERWLKGWMDYHQRIPAGIDKWKSKVKIPLIYTQHNAWLAGMMSAIWKSGLVFGVRARSVDFEKNALAHERLLDWQMRVKTPAKREIRDWLWYSGLLGTGVMRVSWRYEKILARVPERVSMTDPTSGREEFLGSRLEARGVVLYDQPDLCAVDTFNVFLPPWAQAGDFMLPYVIERVETTAEHLTTAAKNGSFGEDGVERIATWLEEGPASDVDSDAVYSNVGSRRSMLEKIGLRDPYDIRGSDRDQRDPRRMPVVYYEMWTREYRIAISGDGTKRVLGKCANPYVFHDVPYVIHNFDRIPHCVYGRGIGDISGPIQSQVDFNWNHGNDAARLRLNAPLLARRAGNSLVEGQLALEPGVVIKVRDTTDVAPLDIPDVLRDVVAMEQHLVVHSDKATGVTEMSRGFADTGINTATEASIVEGFVSQRRDAQLEEIHISCGRLGNLLLMLNQQFITEEQMVRVAGKTGLEYHKIDAQDLVGLFDVVPSASVVKSNRSLRQQQWLTAFPMLAAHPLVNQYEALRRFLREGFEMENVEEMLVQPPSPPHDPMLEEILLVEGVNVDPSPDEDFVTHVQVHAQNLQALMAEPGLKNSMAIAAHQRHIEKTMELFAMVAAGMTAGGGRAPASGGGGAGEGRGPTAGPGGGTPARKTATTLAKGQGSFGSPGSSPGPSGAPGRPQRSAY